MIRQCGHCMFIFQDANNLIFICKICSCLQQILLDFSNCFPVSLLISPRCGVITAVFLKFFHLSAPCTPVFFCSATRFNASASKEMLYSHVTFHILTQNLISVQKFFLFLVRDRSQWHLTSQGSPSEPVLPVLKFYRK